MKLAQNRIALSRRGRDARGAQDRLRATEAAFAAARTHNCITRDVVGQYLMCLAGCASRTKLRNALSTYAPHVPSNPDILAASILCANLPSEWRNITDCIQSKTTAFSRTQLAEILWAVQHHFKRAMGRQQTKAVAHTAYTALKARPHTPEVKRQMRALAFILNKRNDSVGVSAAAEVWHAAAGLLLSKAEGVEEVHLKAMLSSAPSLGSIVTLKSWMQAQHYDSNTPVYQASILKACVNLNEKLPAKQSFDTVLRTNRVSNLDLSAAYLRYLTFAMREGDVAEFLSLETQWRSRRNSPLSKHEINTVGSMLVICAISRYWKNVTTQYAESPQRPAGKKKKKRGVEILVSEGMSAGRKVKGGKVVVSAGAAAVDAVRKEYDTEALRALVAERRRTLAMDGRVHNVLLRFYVDVGDEVESALLQKDANNLRERIASFAGNGGAGGGGGGIERGNIPKHSFVSL